MRRSAQNFVQVNPEVPVVFQKQPTDTIVNMRLLASQLTKTSSMSTLLSIHRVFLKSLDGTLLPFITILPLLWWSSLSLSRWCHPLILVPHFLPGSPCTCLAEACHPWERPTIWASAFWVYRPAAENGRWSLEASHRPQTKAMLLYWFLQSLEIGRQSLSPAPSLKHGKSWIDKGETSHLVIDKLTPRVQANLQQVRRSLPSCLCNYPVVAYLLCRFIAAASQGHQHLAEGLFARNEK